MTLNMGRYKDMKIDTDELSVEMKVEFGHGGYYYMSDENYPNAQHYEFLLKYVDDDFEEHTVGKAEIEGVYNPSDILYFFDLLSDNAVNTAAELIINRKEKVKYCNNFLYLDKLEINEKYRGMGVGSAFLSFIKNYYNNMCYDNYIMFLLASPLHPNEKEELKHASNIMSFYKKNGFEMYKDLTKDRGYKSGLFLHAGSEVEGLTR